MHIGILTRSASGWASSRLIEAVKKLGHKPYPFSFGDLIVQLKDGNVKILTRDLDLINNISAVIVRPIGRSTLEEAIFRLDILYTLEDYGVKVVNSARSIEKAVDKFRTLHILSRHNIPVPNTLVSENPNLAFKNLDVLGHNIVIKPLFGSRGLGSTMLSDRDTIWRIIQHLAYIRNIIYLQEYLEHYHRDIRAFIVGGRVIAAMIRENPESWKTNIARGAKPKPTKLRGYLEELAIKSAEALECEVAGVDILIHNGNPYVLEVNSQPTWKGLQLVTRVNIAEEIVKYVISKVKK